MKFPFNAKIIHFFVHRRSFAEVNPKELHSKTNAFSGNDAFSI